MYTSKEAEKRYELIKDVTTKDQFFKYVEANNKLQAEIDKKKSKK